MNFSKEFFINNRKRLADMHPNSIIIVGSNRPMQRSGDNPYPFHQDGNFWYLTGIIEPNLVLVIDTKNNVDLIAVPNETAVERAFNGQLDTNELEEISGVARYISYDEGRAMHKYFDQYEKVYLNLAKKREGLVINGLRNSIYEEVKGATKSLSDIRPSLDNLRMIKQPQEIEAIKKAIVITKEALSEVAIAVKNGSQSEQELESIINQYFAKRYVQNAFEPIVASGKNSLILHYNKNNKDFNDTDGTVLFDIGAEYNGYCADIARTYVLGKNLLAEKLTKAVLSSQQEIIKYLKPGVTWKQLQLFAENSLIKHLTLAGETVDNSNIKNYFPHSIGHFLGLDAHDTGNYRHPLAENMVITIEPGYYNPSIGFGIRIEDVVLITSNGAEVL